MRVLLCAEGRKSITSAAWPHHSPPLVEPIAMSTDSTAQPDAASTGSQLDRFVKRIHSLYSLPAVALEVVELTRSPSVDAETLTQCLQRDPALVAKVLRAVNSSVYGLPQRVANLKQGLALLGSRPLQLLVLGFSLPPDLLNIAEAKALTRFWHLALVRAVAAREIARRWYRLPADEPFLAGLLQDLGMLALLKEIGSTYARFLDAAEEENLELEEAELAALGFDHRCLSARLLSMWGLPESIVLAIGTGRQYDAISRLPSNVAPLAQVCCLADLTARVLVTKQSGILTRLLDASKTFLNLSLGDVQQLVDGLQEPVYEIAKAMSIELPSGVSYSSIIREAHEQMSRIVEGVQPAPGASGVSTTEATLLEASLLAGVTELSQAAQRTLRGESEPEAPKKTAPSNPPRIPSTALGAMDLLPQVTKAAMRCRQRRQPLSMLLLQLNHADELLLIAGSEEVERLEAALAATVREKHFDEGHPQPLQLLRLGNGALACILENVDRQQAIELARQTIMSLERWVEAECECLVGRLSVSAGAATASHVAKNPPSQKLIDAAERCLAASATLEVSSVKSIDVL